MPKAPVSADSLIAEKTSDLPFALISAVKRIMREACELQAATDHYWARPLEDNLFEWHFTVRGPSGTDFEGGLYHGRILLPPEYPMKPPNIILLTVRLLHWTLLCQLSFFLCLRGSFI